MGDGQARNKIFHHIFFQVRRKKIVKTMLYDSTNTLQNKH